MTSIDMNTQLAEVALVSFVLTLNYLASCSTVSYVNFELGVCRLCMSLVFFVIQFSNLTNPQLTCSVKVTKPFVLNITLSDIFQN